VKPNNMFRKEIVHFTETLKAYGDEKKILDEGKKIKIKKL